MPRHRIDTQRSWTLWPAAGQPARRVPVRAAGRRAKPAHAREVVAPEWRQQLARNQRRMLERAGRRLLVSPWFAAGAGVVLATGAIVYVPHADMNFGGAISVTHCKEAKCRHATPNGAVPLQIGSGQLVSPSPSPPSLPAGMTFSYQMLDRSTPNEFGMVITIRAPQVFTDWTLSVVIPGATQVYAYWPRWKQDGADGISVSYYGGAEAVGYASISDHQSGGDASASRNTYSVQFQVRGSGTPRAPFGCVYNLASCHFTPSPQPDAVNWLGAG